MTYTLTGLAASTAYTVRLHFAELSFTAAGSREFNVAINGTSVLTNFDVFATAGAQNKAVVESFAANSTSSGQIVITFTVGAKDNPEIAGIEIDSTTPVVPNAPTNLAATGGNAQVVLTWTGVSNATSYNVYRGTAAGGESATAIVTGVTTASYTNTGLTNGTAYYYTVKAVNSVGTSGASNEAHATPSAGLTAVVQINTGGGLVSPFVADEDFSGGTEFSSTATINTSGASNPAPAAVYQTVRWGAMTYTIGGLTANAGYTVRLHFCELSFTASGSREFNVAIDGTTVLTNFDVFAAAGGQNRAVTEQFTTTSNGSGQVSIVFTVGAKDNPEIAGIEILH
jgi:hypothetical protein